MSVLVPMTEQEKEALTIAQVMILAFELLQEPENDRERRGACDELLDEHAKER